MRKINLILSSIVVIAILALAGSCMQKVDHRVALQAKVDSLAAVILDKENMESILIEAETLLDSIDANRNVLRYRMWEGTSYNDFTSRISDLNEYVKKSEDKIAQLENALRAAKQSGSSYSGRIAALKKELEKSNMELTKVQNLVAQYRGENDELIKTVDLLKAEVEDKTLQIATKEEEIENLETHINEILAQAQQTEADLYFAQAEALELAATRTSFLNTKRRKNTRQQAIAMYKMAALYGKEEAQTKADELAKKL